MAIHSWSLLTNEQDVFFNPLADQLSFDNAAISAANVLLDLSVPSQATFSYGGKSVTLLTAPATLATINVTFQNGSLLLVGDNTSGTAADDSANALNGTAGNDQLIGLGGDDTLTGGLGIDGLSGSGGNDRYVVSATGTAGVSGIVFVPDAVHENAGGGIDTVYSGASYALPAHIENLVLTGAPFWRPYTGSGNELDNVITGEGAARHILYGRGGDDTLDGGGGADTLDGGGGADVFRGGEGDDRIVVPDTGFFDVDGGSDADTLALAGSGLHLDLTAIANTKITGIEMVDLTGGGNNTLTLTTLDLLDLSDTTNTLRVDGDAGNSVSAGTGWFYTGNIASGGQTYALYAQGAAVLQVDADISRDIGFTINLSSLGGDVGFRLSGAAAGDSSGSSVSGAGDVNGDGYADLIVGAYGADPNGGGSGASYVVFGASGGFAANVALSSLTGANGFRLSGVAGDDQSGYSVSGAGDVNGDGYDDLIVGANGADPNGSDSGASYVVFGASGGFAANVELSSLTGANGFRLSGVAAGDSSGFSVSGAGDVNGDGYDDLIVGARLADPHGSGSGASYVVFGASGGFAANVNLSSLNGANGFRLSGVAASDYSGRSVSGAGDVNGDGYDDLIVGAYRAEPNGNYSGASYVVFGASGGFAANVELSSLNGANGFQLSGVAADDRSGRSVSGAGDVNGDGYDDLIVGAYRADPNGNLSGASYVVFGASGGFAANVNLSSLNGTNGFQLSGVGVNDYSGSSVSGAGDVNGDGYDDLIVGANGADPNGSDSGASYVVFGASGGFAANVNLSSLNGANGFRFSGVGVNDFSGYSVSGAGDVNGDGYDDLIVGAQSADPNGSLSGASYVVYGVDFTGAVVHLGTAGPDALAGDGAAETFVAGQGNDTLDGGGGADVFRGGEGDDRIVVPDAGFFDVDGGGGLDTLALDGSGINLDLTAIANTKVTGVEAIDLTGSGANSLTLVLGDVLDLPDGAATLRIEGSADDSVIVADGGWMDDGIGVVPGYHQYTLGAATLLISTAITDVTLPT